MTPIIKSYRKKPVIVTAMQYTGENVLSCRKFCDLLTISPDFEKVYIETNVGNVRLYKGEYIIKDAAGVFYTCSEQMLLETFDEIVE